MGMSLYLKSGAERDLATLARDPDALMAASMPTIDYAGLAAEFPAEALSPQALNQHMASVDAMFKGHGLRGWIMKFFLKRQMRDAQSKLAEQMRRVRSAAQAAAQEPGQEPGRVTGQTAGPGAAGTEDPALDLHKSWHALHFLLSGSAWEGSGPAATLLAGGKAVGEDLGYGPARLVSAAETAAFNRFLADQSPDDLLDRIDLNAMGAQQIYCADGDDEDADELGEFVEHYFTQLKDYVAAAAKRGHGLAIWMA